MLIERFRDFYCDLFSFKPYETLTFLWTNFVLVYLFENISINQNCIQQDNIKILP